MQWQFLKYKLKYRFTRQQKKALAGKIPMTEDLFWGCLDIYYLRLEMENFWKVWNAHPEYVRRWQADIDEKMADPNSEIRKEADRWKARITSILEKVMEENQHPDHTVSR